MTHLSDDETVAKMGHPNLGVGHLVKHLPAYLDETTFRFNNRDGPFLFRDTLIKLIEAPVLEYKKLTAA
jgi:hypothetical protein